MLVSRVLSLPFLLFISLNLLARDVNSSGTVGKALSLEETTSLSPMTVLASIRTVDRKHGRFVARIDNIWTQKDVEPSLKIGDVVSMRLRPKPKARKGKWVIVPQYWDAANEQVIKPGKTLVLFSSDKKATWINYVALNTPRIKRKLRFIYTKEWSARYGQSSTAELWSDLADFDLYKQAYLQLKKRKKLTAQAIFQAFSTGNPEDIFRSKSNEIFRFYLGKMGPNFLKNAAMSSSKENATLTAIVGHYFNRLYYNEYQYKKDGLPSKELEELQVYLSGLDFKKDEHTRYLDDLIELIFYHINTPQGRPDSGRFIKAFLQYIKRANNSPKVKERVWRFYGVLSDKDKTSFARELKYEKDKLETWLQDH